MPKLLHPCPDPTIPEAFALRLRQLRMDHGRVVGRPMSQPVFAALLGLEAATYGSYERGDRQPPLAVLVGLRRVTGISLDVLLADVPGVGGVPPPSGQTPRPGGDVTSIALHQRDSKWLQDS